jgi:hypothetical protein
MGARLYAIAGLGAAILVISQASCERAPAFTADRTLTGTVSLGLETALKIESSVPVIIEGNPRLDEIYFKAEVTVTETSTALANEKAAALEVKVAQSDADRLVTIALIDPTMTGVLTIQVPSDLDLGIASGGSTEVEGMDGDIDVNALSGVMIVGVQKGLRVRAQAGPIKIDSDVLPSTGADVEIGAGDIELVAPSRVSALFDVKAGNGAIVIQHPQLPPWAGGGQPYQANVNGGLALVHLLTNGGNIVIRGE